MKKINFLNRFFTTTIIIIPFERVLYSRVRVLLLKHIFDYLRVIYDFLDRFRRLFIRSTDPLTKQYRTLTTVDRPTADATERRVERRTRSRVLGLFLRPAGRARHSPPAGRRAFGLTTEPPSGLGACASAIERGAQGSYATRQHRRATIPVLCTFNKT